MQSIWPIIGLNPWQESVVESPEGDRWVSTSIGWASESDVEPFRVCRWKHRGDQDRTLESLSTPGVLEAFGAQWERLWVIHRLPRGVPLHREIVWTEQERELCQQFRLKIKHHQVEQIEQALRRGSWGASVFPWKNWWGDMHHQQSLGFRWTLMSWLKHHEKEHETWEEWGQDQGVSQALQQSKRWVRHPQSPHEEPSPRRWSSGLKAFGGRSSASPSRSKEEEKSPVKKGVIVWVSAHATVEQQKYGEHEWRQVFESPAGVLVWPDLGAHESGWMRYLSTLLNQIKPHESLRVWSIQDHGSVMYWGKWSEAWEGRITLEEAKEAWFEPSLVPDMVELKGDKIPYQAWSDHGSVEGMVSASLAWPTQQALREAREKSQYQNPLKKVAQALQESEDRLKDQLSPEQTDAVCLALASLEEKKGFLLSDETGFGKGRTLAALVKAGLLQGRTVLFVTENAPLFSDFYRDLEAVCERPPLPTVLHQTAGVYNPEGELVVRPWGAKGFKQLIKTLEWEPTTPRLVMATYAQLSRMDEDKIKWLKSRLGDRAWWVMDEAHNAAGDSNVGSRLIKWIKKAEGVVFASATFAKHEANLPLYKAVMDLPLWTEHVLTPALAQDQGLLRELLTQQMARSGRFIRREHSPVDPPQPVFVNMDPYQEVLSQFGKAWQSIFEAAETYQKVVQRESVWNKIGGALSRSIKEFNLWLKAPALIELIEQKQKENKKVVVAVDATLESALFQEGEDDWWEEDVWVQAGPHEETEEGVSVYMDPQSAASLVAPSRSEKGPEGEQRLPPMPTWKHRLKMHLNTVCPASALEGAVFEAQDELREKYEAAQSWIEKLPDWHVSPMDWVRQQLEKKGITHGELSGRHHRLIVPGYQHEKNHEGSSKESLEWAIESRQDLDRQTTVRAFNEGQLEVLLLTRAGCTGISLHAGQKFKDQRVRCLIEWDIPPNPVNRLQFWGRVRRKDQVVEPEFMGLVLDTPEDRRIVEKEQRKKNKLLAHLGQRQSVMAMEDLLPFTQENSSTSLEWPWVSIEGEHLVGEWAQWNPFWARRLGVQQSHAEDPTHRVDKALARSLVLPSRIRAELFDHLEKGLIRFKPFAQQKHRYQPQGWSWVLERHWFWGQGTVSKDPLHSKGLELVYRAWAQKDPGVDLRLQSMKVALEKAREQMPMNWETWARPWTHESTGAHRQRMQWKKRWKNVEVGQAVEWVHPYRKEKVKGLFLGFSWDPEADAWSHMSIGIWSIGDAQALWCPLSMIKMHEELMPLNIKAQPSWFSGPLAPHRAWCLEGNPWQAAAWGQRWGWGQPEWVQDAQEGPLLSWVLPRQIQRDQWLGLAKDLLDVDHVLQCLRAFPDQSLMAGLKHHQALWMTPVQGGLRLDLNKKTYDQLRKSWLHHSMIQKMKLYTPPGQKGEIMVNGKIEWKHAAHLLHQLWSLGVVWRLPLQKPEHREWYEKTSRVFEFKKTKK